jgi:hypothetical protein
MVFLSLLERKVASRAEFVAMRSARHTQDFLRRWNVVAYFKLRFQDIVRRMDAALSPSYAIDLPLPAGESLRDSCLSSV